jgi:hypothetical protein
MSFTSEIKGKTYINAVVKGHRYSPQYNIGLGHIADAGSQLYCVSDRGFKVSFTLDDTKTFWHLHKKLSNAFTTLYKPYKIAPDAVFTVELEQFGEKRVFTSRTYEYLLAYSAFEKVVETTSEKISIVDGQVAQHWTKKRVSFHKLVVNVKSPRLSTYTITHGPLCAYFANEHDMEMISMMRQFGCVFNPTNGREIDTPYGKIYAPKGVDDYPLEDVIVFVWACFAPTTAPLPPNLCGSE